MNYPNFQTIIVDNGSVDDSVATFRSQYPSIPVIETKANLGFAGGNNIGIEWALKNKAEWILLLNNDTTVDPDFLSAFMESAKEQPSAKILGAKILRYHTPNIIDHLGGFWSSEKGEFVCPECGEEDHPYFEMEPVDYVCGAALLFHKSVPAAIGLLEPRYFLFWEESDFCTQAKHHGLEVWTAPKAKIYHKVSSSFTGGKPQMHYFWWRSRLLWISRNCSTEQKWDLYRRILIPECWKMIRRALTKSLFGTKKPDELKRNKAGLLGIYDYYRGNFGNSPESLRKK